MFYSYGAKWILKANGVTFNLVENRRNIIDIGGNCDSFVIEVTLDVKHDSFPGTTLFSQHFSRDDPSFVVRVNPTDAPDKSFVLDSPDTEVVYSGT